MDNVRSRTNLNVVQTFDERIRYLIQPWTQTFQWLMKMRRKSVIATERCSTRCIHSALEKPKFSRNSRIELNCIQFVRAAFRAQCYRHLHYSTSSWPIIDPFRRNQQSSWQQWQEQRYTHENVVSMSDALRRTDFIGYAGQLIRLLVPWKNSNTHKWHNNELIPPLGRVHSIRRRYFPQPLLRQVQHFDIVLEMTFVSQYSSGWNIDASNW